MLNIARQSKVKAFIPFLVVGYPTLKASFQIIDLFIAEGADLIELGVPFTDAMADGPVIQRASESAAKKGIGLTQVLAFASEVKKKYPQIGLVLFTYYNPIFKRGLKTFATEAKIAGIDGVLCVDLPPEEAADYRQSLKAVGVGAVFLIAPTTHKNRVKLIDEASTEFIYYVSRTGVTGVQSDLSLTLKAELTQIRKLTTKPIALGFGISNGSQAREVVSLVDGVVIGSAFMKIISEFSDLDVANEKIKLLARELRSAINGEIK